MQQTGPTDERPRVTHDLLRRAHELAGIGSYEIDLTRRVIHLSAEMAHLLRAGESALSMPLSEYRRRFYHPEDRVHNVAKAERAYDSGDSVALESRVIRGDGEVIWVRASSSTERNAEGEPIVVGMLVDVTEQRRATRSLVASDALLRQFIESTPAAVAMFDREMRYLHVSARWITDYHLEGVDVIGRCHYEVFADIPDRWKAVHQRALAGAHERCDDDPFPRADGAMEWLQWDVQPWRDAAGDIGGIIMLTQVITARKLAEAHLQESEQRFRALSDNSLVGIYVHQDLRVTYVNPAIERIFGYQPGELLGQHPHVVIHPLDRAFAEDITRQRLAGELDNVAHDVRGVRKDGSTIHVVVFAFLGEMGGHRCVIGNIVDVTERRLAEERLRESEERFRRLAESSLAGIYIAQDGRFAYVNPALAAMYETEPAAMVGTDLFAAVHPDDRQAVMERVQRRLVGEVDGARYEMRSFTRGGRPLWLEVLGSRMEHEGRPAVFGHVHDITARKQAEAELQRSEQRWRTLIEDAPVAIGIQRDGLTMYANRKFRELWRFPSLEAALGVPIGTMWTASFSAVAMEYAHRRTRAGAPASYQSVAVRLDGTTFHAQNDVVTVELPDGPAGVAFLTDLTERDQTEAAIRESEARFRQLAETIDQVFWIEDVAAGRLVYVSPAFERIWGRPPSLDEAWPPAVHPDDRERRGTYRIIRPDGAVRWIRERSFPVRDERGEVYRVIGAASDITEHENLERQLLQSQKMEAIGVLAGGVAHDFNNLLAVILSYTCLVLDELPAGDPRAADLREVEHAAGRAAQMTKQLLAFSRRQIAQPHVVDVNDVLAGCEKMLRRLIGEHIELVTTTSSVAASAFVDPGQIEQVLMNLVVNARDAMPHGGRITIDVAFATLAAADPGRGLAAGRHVVVSVTDTGVGMDDAIRSRIFEPFYTTKEVGKGTGLGLSTVFGIVKQSGGHVDVDSELGRGATFRIWLPYAAGERTSVIAGLAAPVARGGETILLVEDEDAVRRLVRTVLSRHGYVVLDCRSGGDALVISERHPGPIDLLLTDVVMPLMSGDQLYERLRGSRPTMRVAFMSGYAEKGDAARGAVPAELFVPKPFTPEALLRRVRELLA